MVGHRLHGRQVTGQGGSNTARGNSDSCCSSSTELNSVTVTLCSKKLPTPFMQDSLRVAIGPVWSCMYSDQDEQRERYGGQGSGEEDLLVIEEGHTGGSWLESQPKPKPE